MASSFLGSSHPKYLHSSFLPILAISSIPLFTFSGEANWNFIRLILTFQRSSREGKQASIAKGIKNLALQDSAYTEKSAVVTNIRHYDCLKRAKENLLNAKNTAVLKLSGEFLASDFRAAEIALAEIIGEVTPEEILNNIFSKFCIGK